MNDSIDSSAAAPTPIIPPNNNPDIQVLLRIRPLSARELHHSASAVLQFENGDDGATVRVVDGATNNNNNNSGYGSGDNGRKVGSNICTTPSSGKSYNYDAVYGPDSTQVEVFHGVKGIVDAVCEGYNGTIVAYGQTGSGKVSVSSILDVFIVRFECCCILTVFNIILLYHYKDPHYLRRGRTVSFIY